MLRIKREYCHMFEVPKSYELPQVLPLFLQVHIHMNMVLYYLTCHFYYIFHLDFYFCAYQSYTNTFFTFGHIYFYMFNAMSKEILGVNNFRKRVCATAQLHATIFSKVTICDYNRHFGISKIGFCKISFSMASHS